jgi:hypothetical protein
MKALLKFLKRYNELWLAPLAFLLYLVSEWFVKLADPEAVPYTIDAIQKILFGHLVFGCCTFSAWLCLRLTWPSVFRILVDEFNDSLNKLNTWEKLRLCYWVFASYLLGLILCMLVL